MFQIWGRAGAAGRGGKLYFEKYKPQTTAFSFKAVAGGTLRVKNSLRNSNWGESRAEGAALGKAAVFRLSFAGKSDPLSSGRAGGYVQFLVPPRASDELNSSC